MISNEVESQLLSLSKAEKTQVIQMLLQSISDTWIGIEKTSGVCGGDACFENTRNPVWVLVQARELGNTDAELLQNYPTLDAASLANAWAYASSHQEEIKQTIRENDRA